MDDFSTAERQMMASPNWRDLADRAATQRAHLSHDGLPKVIGETVHALLWNVHRSPDPESTIRALRRLDRVVAGFAGLSHAHRAAMAGQCLLGEEMGKTGTQIGALVRARTLDAWRSDPALAELLADREAQAEAAADRQRHGQEAQRQAAADAERRASEAPGIVLDWNARGIRLDVADDRVRAFPRDAMTTADLATLASHAPELVTAVRAQWVTA